MGGMLLGVWGCGGRAPVSERGPNFLIPKLPAPKEEDLSKGILETIDMDSYRSEKQAAIKVQLHDASAEIEPVPASGGGFIAEPELDRLSNILKTFNELFGNIPQCLI